MMIIVLMAGVAALCISSSGALGMAYWQNWLCDSLGEEFGNSCPVKQAIPTGDESVPPAGDDTPSEDDNKDDDNKDDKKKNDTNDNKKRLIDAYGWMLDDKGKAKSGRSSWATLYHKSCKHPVWRDDWGSSLKENPFKIAPQESCGGTGWRLSGSYNNYKLNVHKDQSTKPVGLSGKYGFYDVASNGEFKLKNKTTGKWLKLSSCSAGEYLQFVSNISSASKFKFHDKCL